MALDNHNNNEDHNKNHNNNNDKNHSNNNLVQKNSLRQLHWIVAI